MIWGIATITIMMDHHGIVASTGSNINIERCPEAVKEIIKQTEECLSGQLSKYSAPAYERVIAEETRNRKDGGAIKHEN
jgi:hypothetical protein